MTSNGEALLWLRRDTWLAKPTLAVQTKGGVHVRSRIRRDRRSNALVIELILLRGFAPMSEGVEHGVGPWLTRTLGRQFLRLIGVASLGLSAVKVVYESCAGHALLARDLGTGVALLPAAHAFGALVGLAVYCLLPSKRGAQTRCTNAVNASRLTRSQTPQY
jgi:hypothetical protein